MRVLFFTRLFYPHIGGVEEHVLKISQELINAGHQITIVTELLPQTKVFEKINNITIYRIPVPSDEKKKKFVIWKWLWQHKDIIKNTDIIHCHDVFFWYLPFRFFYINKPVFTTFHGYETKFPLAKKAIFIRKISELLSNGNICVGDFIKKWYKTKPTFITYGGTNTLVNEKIINRKNINKLRIAIIGRLEKDTGMQLYYDGLKDLNGNYALDIYGQGIFQKKLSKLGKIHGTISNVNEKIQNADVVLASSYLSILDTLALGRYCIAVYENKLKEDYLKMSPFRKYIFITDSAEEIKTIILSIKNDPWQYSTMLQAGSKWAQLQTWEKVSQTYVKLWSSKK